MRGQLAREIRSCEICRRGLVYAVVPTSGVTPEPPQMYGPELNGGQKPAALAVWDRAIAEAAAAEETRLMELHMPPALVLDDVLPPQTIGTAFIGPGVPGGHSYMCDHVPVQQGDERWLIAPGVICACPFGAITPVGECRQLTNCRTCQFYKWSNGLVPDNRL